MVASGLFAGNPPTGRARSLVSPCTRISIILTRHRTRGEAENKSTQDAICLSRPTRKQRPRGSGAPSTGYRGAVTVRVMPNLGRDIGPLLTGFGEEIASGGYDLWGHVHGKKSAWSDPGIGDAFGRSCGTISSAANIPCSTLLPAPSHPTRNLGLFLPRTRIWSDGTAIARMRKRLRADGAFARTT